jgi:gamma-glutamyltranspeptidase/glutathione hydrolase
MAARSSITLARDGVVSSAHPIGSLVGVHVLEPHKRTRTTLSPAIVLRDGRPYLAVGCVGGQQQTPGLQQVLAHHLDGGLAVADAIAAPRWALDEAGGLHVEPGLAAAVAGLAARGHRPVVGGAYFGAGQAVWLDPATGTLAGASDPRHDGAAVGY